MVRRVYLDANIFIYLFEDREPQKSKFLQFHNQYNPQYYTSVFTIGEIVVNPFKLHRNDLVLAYRENIREFVHRIIEIDEEICVQYAAMRAVNPKISKPDVLHLACAKQAGLEFITNDKNLWKLKIEGLEIVGL
jgi:predicted nucleic acid-binding protein